MATPYEQLIGEENAHAFLRLITNKIDLKIPDYVTPYQMKLKDSLNDGRTQAKLFISNLPSSQLYATDFTIYGPWTQTTYTDKWKTAIIAYDLGMNTRQVDTSGFINVKEVQVTPPKRKQVELEPLTYKKAKYPTPNGDGSGANSINSDPIQV